MFCEPGAGKQQRASSGQAADMQLARSWLARSRRATECALDRVVAGGHPPTAIVQSW